MHRRRETMGAMEAEVCKVLLVLVGLPGDCYGLDRGKLCGAYVLGFGEAPPGPKCQRQGFYVALRTPAKG